MNTVNLFALFMHSFNVIDILIQLFLLTLFFTFKLGKIKWTQISKEKQSTLLKKKKLNMISLKHYRGEQEKSRKIKENLDEEIKNDLR